MKRSLKYIHFVHSHHETQDKCILSEVLGQKPGPPRPPKIPHRALTPLEKKCRPHRQIPVFAPGCNSPVNL